jgi:hypothetical protein
MRNSAYQLLVGSILLFVLAPMTAAAQVGSHIDVTVPFRFYVHNTAFPAGTYTISPLSSVEPGVLVIRGVSNSSSAFVITEPSLSDVPFTQTTVDFCRIGKKEVLDDIQVAGRERSFQVLPKESQKALTAKGAHASIHSIVARHESS